MKVSPDSAENERISRRLFLGGVGSMFVTPVSRGRERSLAHRVDTKGEFSEDPTWGQDFSTMSDGPVDTSVWTYDLNPDVPGYNDEAQGYSDSTRNVRIEDGVLVIEAHRESYQYLNDPEGKTYEITSGRIDTRDSFTFEYGRIEATMKLPKGNGTWPAFWMLSANQPFTEALHPTDEDWSEERFYKHDGELDVLEAYGDKPGSIESTVHTFSDVDGATIQVPDASDAFHTYAVEVSPTQLVWTVDGAPYHTYEKPSDNTDDWPFAFGNQFYVILNLAMGSYGGGIDPAEDSWRMEVQKLNFYKYNSN